VESKKKYLSTFAICEDVFKVQIYRPENGNIFDSVSTWDIAEGIDQTYPWNQPR